MPRAHVGERVARDGAGGARVVDPRVADLGGLAARGHARRGGRERRRAPVGQRDAADRALREVRAPDRDVLAPVEDLGAALLVEPGGGEDELARPPRGEDERVVLLGLGGLGEHEVVRDGAGAGAAQLVDDVRVHGARERRLDVEVVQRLRVDGHEHDVLRRILPAADREARVDGRELDRAHGSRLAGEEPDRRRGRARREEQQGAAEMAAAAHGGVGAYVSRR